MKRIINLIVMVSCLFMTNCEEGGISIIGSKNHDITSATAKEPEILANGISTTRITVNVRNKEDGSNAPNMKVHFETTAGSIEPYGITNSSGNAEVTLTSAASETDLIAEVTATVVDTNFTPLNKKVASGFEITISAPDFEHYNKKHRSLTKKGEHQDNRATIRVKFLGVSLQAEIEDAVLPADGISETKVEIRLREITSLKIIQNAEIRFLLTYGTIAGSVKTDAQGNSQAYLKSAKKAVKDTLIIEYGNKISRRIAVEYITPKFELNPKKARIPADGVSKVQMIATLLNQQNNPISGAKIKFSATSGIILESAITDNYGQAKADLVAERQPDSLVKVIARFLSLSDSAMISFVSIDVKSITITGETEPIIRDGVASKQFSLLAKNSLESPVANVVINLRTDIGNVSESIVTDQQGKANFNYTADAGYSDATATITASVGNAQASQTVKLLGINMTVSANPASLLADGRSTSSIRVEVKQTTSHAAVTSHSINFSVDLGTIASTSSTDNQGIATVSYTAANVPGIATVKVACGKLPGEVKLALLANYPKSITLNADSEPLLRDGVASKQLSLQATNELGQPVANVAVNISTNLGTVPASVVTDQPGNATVKYIADAGTSDATATITASAGTAQASQNVNLIGISIRLSAKPDSIAADGKSTSIIRVEVKQTTTNISVASHPIGFATDNGTIPTTATTDNQGVATTTFTSSTQPGAANITVTCGTLIQRVRVYLFSNFPNSILLAAEPNFIYVKGTGNIQQSIITATVLGVTGEPVGDDYGVKFRIVNAPGGGEIVEPSGGSGLETTIIRTVNGKAEAKLLAGTISGTVQIRAELVDFPQVNAKTTNIVIRSGPPYIWIDPNNANNVIHHATIAVEPGKYNTCFGNPIQDIEVTTYFGDKYNNPVEDGTTIYFTTTGGIITTDAATCQKGQASVILQNVNPFPRLVSEDPNQLTALRIPNPNNPSQMLNVNLPDFEFGEVTNSIGTTKENDGMAIILAYTWGKDQNGRDVKVWTTAGVIYSVGLKRFTVEVDKTSLLPGELATFIIRVYDYNGNPVAAGSSLSVSTTAGELSDTSLMPGADKYGYGNTRFSVQLLNNLKPGEDKPTVALVKINLDSPNGTGTHSIPISLKITP